MCRLLIPVAVLFYGSARSEERIKLSSVDITFYGEHEGDESGYSLCNNGDVNGDGYDDILIGAPGSDEGGSDAGQVYVIFGKGEWKKGKIDLSRADASFFGETAGDRAGYVCIPGDVNGDGYDDIVIGAPANDESRVDAGKTYLFFGKEYGWDMRTSLANADASFVGEGEGDQSGRPLVGTGDVNNDGYDDFLISAPLNDAGGENTGQTYLVLGKPSGWNKQVSLSRSEASFVGQLPGDQSTCAQGKAGDVNGDEYDDLLFCSWRSGEHRGQCYIILGKQRGWSMQFPLFRADASFMGDKMGDRAGYAACGVNDMNGDGYADIAVAAPGSDRNGEDAGRVYVIFGMFDGWGMNMSLESSDVSFIGEHEGDELSSCLSGIDYNQDGYTDLLVGAPFSDRGGEDTGRICLFLGRESGWEAHMNMGNADVIFRGEKNGDRAGFALAGHGDVNGDGYPDGVIGAPGSDARGANSGRMYILFEITPRLCVNPDTLDFGELKKEQEITVRNCGIGELSWEINTEKSWSTVSPATGFFSRGKENVTVTIDRTDFEVGSYSCSLWVESNGGAESIFLTMEITDHPRLCVDRETLDLGESQATESFTINNCGTGILEWSIICNQIWITVQPGSGSMSDEREYITITGERSDLDPGEYSTTIHVTSNGGEQDILVTLKKKSVPKTEKE